MYFPDDTMETKEEPPDETQVVKHLLRIRNKVRKLNRSDESSIFANERNDTSTRQNSMGGDLGGTGGRFPPKFVVGDCPCIRPPIFGEVLLSDVCESTN